jgi:hypothetical protein
MREFPAPGRKVLLHCNAPRPLSGLHCGLGYGADLINAVGLFLDRWGRQAVALGWDSIDLFGTLPAAPLARIDQQGLVFFLRDGGEVVGMTAHTATIRRPSVAVQTFAAVPQRPGSHAPFRSGSSSPAEAVSHDPRGLWP